MFRSMRAPTPARRRIARLTALWLAVALLFAGLLHAPRAVAVDVGVGTVAKALDPVQGVGFTAPNTFATGALVRYRLTASCSSNVQNCGIGTITDTLDPNLQFQSVVFPGNTSLPMSHSETGQQVTITLGSGTNPWPDGNTLEIVLVAKVRADFLGGTIPNQASISTKSTDGATTGPTSQSQVVQIVVPGPAKTWRMTKTADGTSVALGETMTYTIGFGIPSPAVGIMWVNGATLVDTFPAGALVVDPATGNTIPDGGTIPSWGGVVNYTNHTITWTLPPGDPTNVNCSGGGAYCSFTGWYPTPRVTLRFPAGSFTGGQTLTNSATVTLNYKDGTTGTLTSAADVTIKGVVHNATLEKNYSGPDPVAGEKFSYFIRTTNTGNVTETNWTLTDTLPPGTFFGNVVLSVYSTPALGTKVETFDGTSWVTVYTWTSGPWVNPSLPAGQPFRITLPTLAPGAAVAFYVTGTVPSTAPVGQTFTNCLDLGTSSVLTTPPGQKCKTLTVSAPVSQIMTWKTHAYPDAASGSVPPLTEFQVGVGLTRLTGSPLTVADIIDVLPREFEYVRTNCYTTWNSGYGIVSDVRASCPAGSNTVPAADPQIVANPNGTTTLRWHLDPIPFDMSDGKTLSVVFTIRARSGTATNNYVNQAYVTNPLVPTTCPTSGTYRNTQTVDTSDLSGNGSTTDTLCGRTDTLQVRLAAIADVYKWVKGNVGENVYESTGLTTPAAGETPTTCPNLNGYTRYPCVAKVTPSGTFDYKLQMVNTGNVPLTDFVMYDILPHIGDVGVNQALANSQRLSEWTPVLTGPVVADPATVPAGVTPVALYNLSYDPCRPEMSAPTPGVNWQGAACGDPVGGTNAQNTWYTQAQIQALPGAWANVKSFKIVAFTGERVLANAWQGGSTIDFHAPMQAPANSPASVIPGVDGISPSRTLDLSAAWNSIGHQEYSLSVTGQTSSLPAAAPRKVGIIVPAKPQVQVGDYVWKDLNGNGIQDAGEPGIDGVVLTLSDESGNPVTDVFNNPVGPVTTEAGGHYVFPNLPIGHTYTVTIDQAASAAALAGLVPTTPQAAGSTTANDSSIWTATSVSLTADGNKDLTLDFGFKEPARVSIGDRVWSDSNGNGIQDSGEPGVPNVTVRLLDAALNPVLDAASQPRVAVTDSNGNYAFTGLEPGTQCTVEFVKPANTLFTLQNAPVPPATTGDTSNSPTTDLLDSDADPTTGRVTFTTPASGNNWGTPNAADNPGIDAGLISLVSIGDYVWWDNNRNGIQGAGEPVVPDGFVVRLLDRNGAFVKQTSTSGGYYAFTDLPAGTDYIVEFVKSSTTATADASFTTQNSGTDGARDSNADPATGRALVTTPTSGNNLGTPTNADNPTIDAGLVKFNLTLTKTLTSTGPFVPGQQVTYSLVPRNEGPSAALTGWTVTDVVDPAQFTSVTLDGGSAYSCAGLVCTANAQLAPNTDGPGITVTATIAAGATGDLKNVAYVSPGPNEVPETIPLVVPGLTTDTSTNATDNDAQASLNVPKVSIGDYAWFDINRDGLQNEPPSAAAEGITVRLYLGTKTAGEAPVATTTTANGGYYAFTDLAPSTEYTVEFVLPNGTAFTTQNAPIGGGDASNSPTTDLTDSDADPATGLVTFTTPVSGNNLGTPNQADNHGIDAGLVRYNLQLAKTLLTSTAVYPGDTVQFRLTPSNDGPVTALAGWIVTDLLPANLQLVTMDGGPAYNCTANVCQANDPLPAGQGPTILVTAKVLQSGATKNVAYIDKAPADAAETNPLIQGTETLPTNDTDTSTSRTDNDAEAPLTAASLVSVGDHVWWDINRDGQQNDGPTSPIANVTVNLYEGDVATGGTPLKTTTTNVQGFYSFTDLIPGGLYTIEFVKPGNTSFTTVNVGADSSDSDADPATGRVLITAPASGGNSATAPDDPTWDAGLVQYNLTLTKVLTTSPPFVPGQEVTYTLTPHNDGPTDALAGWSVVDLLPAGLEFVSSTGTGYDCTTTPGSCVASGPLTSGADGAPITVTARIAANFTGSAKNVAYVQPLQPAGTTPGDAPETNPLGDPVPTLDTDTATSPTDNDAQALLEVKKVSIGDYVWNDANRNGIQDATEAGVPHVTVILFAADGTTEIARTTTDANGFYSFTGLLPATTYAVEFVKPDGMSFTDPNQGGDDAKDSDPVIDTGRVTVTTPSTGNDSATQPDNPTIDAGLVENRVVKLEKQSVNCDATVTSCALTGADYALYDVDPTSAGATPIANGITVDPADGALFLTKALPLGNYWLMETKAPTGFELLSTPIVFTLTKDGVTLAPSETSRIVTVKGTGEDAFTIVVSDAPAAALPLSGGGGVGPFAAGGVLLLLIAGAYISGLHRRIATRFTSAH